MSTQFNNKEWQIMLLPSFFNEKVANNRKTALSNLIQRCDKCNHMGYIETGDNMFVDCDCVKYFNKIRKYLNCGLNENEIYTDKDLKCFPEVVLEKIKHMIPSIEAYSKENIFYYLLTKSSYGSEIVAKYLFKKLCSYCDCYTISMKVLLDLFFDFDTDENKECMAFLKTVRVLLITGMGSEYNSKMKESASFVVSSLNGFLAERKGLATWVSASFTKETLHATYSKELVSLITKNFLGFGVESLERQETAYDIIRKKKLDVGFDDLELIKPVRKKIR